MTRPPPTIHALPIGARGDHRPHACPCRPVECVELMGGPLGRIVYVHRDLAPAVAHPVDVPESAA